MPDAVEVYPTKLAHAGNDMLGIANQLRTIVVNLDDSVSKNGVETWGGDSFGEGFADGDNGYIASRRQLLAGGHEMVTTINQFGNGMIEGAASLTAADRVAGHLVRSVWLAA